MRSLVLLAVIAAACAVGARAAVPLASLSDEFESEASLGGWTRFDGDFPPAQVEVGGGEVRVTPSKSWWVHDDRAFALTKDVTGDFVATMRIDVTGVAAAKPGRDWSLSGFLVRSPASRKGRESWLAFRTGVVGGGWVFERKTTIGSRSVLVLSEAPGGWTELRVARVGPAFIYLRRQPGGPWRVHYEYRRADLPATLQVGLDAFSGFEDEGPDLTSHVDFVRFAPTKIPAKLKTSYLKGKAKRAALLPYLTR